MINISDFKLALTIIKKACKTAGCPFIDLPISFSNNNDDFGYRDGEILVGNPNCLGDTMARIVMAYLSSFKEINNKDIDIFADEEQKKNVYIAVNNFFRVLTFSQNSFLDVKQEDPISKRLYQYPFVWTIMKDIVCPAFNSLPVNNPIVAEASSNDMDICSKIEKDGEYILVVNNSIEYKPCLDVFLLYCAIENQGLDAKSVIRNILDSQLRIVLIDSLELVYKTDILDDNNIRDFLFTLMTISEYENMSEELVDQISKRFYISENSLSQKTAQFLNPAYNISDTFWFLGILEKMLGAARGADWSTYKKLHPYFEKFWNKVEVERKKRGREGLTYEALLRIKNKEEDPKKKMLIEKALASDRVW